MSDKTTSSIQRIEGRLHLIRQVTDDDGNPVATVSEPVQNMILLLIMVVIRTFLGWSTILEITGRWPWRIGSEAE